MKKKHRPLGRRFDGLSLGLAALFALLAFAPAQGFAQTAKEKARATALLKEGAGFLADKEFSAALEKFEAAYAIVPSPKILFNVGLANEGLARPARAMRAFSDYVVGATSDTAERRKEAETRIKALRSKVAMVVVEADVAGALVSIDGEESGATPLPGPIPVEPGNHQVMVQAATGRPWSKAIKAIAGSTLRLQATVKEVPVAVVPVIEGPRPLPTTVTTDPTAPRSDLTATAAPSSEGNDQSVYTKGWFWGVVGVAVAAGVVTAILLSSGGSTTEYQCAAGVDVCIP